MLPDVRAEVAEEMRATMKRKTTTIRVSLRATATRPASVETWEVPRGFGATYQRIAQRAVSARVLRDIISLVGYTATDETIAGWDARKRVELIAYAANCHARASDNPIQRHPPLPWLPEPWQGDGWSRGYVTGPGPTVIADSTPRRALPAESPALPAAGGDHLQH